MRVRWTLSALLLVVGAVLLVAGTAALYARTQLIERERFADRAQEAFRRPAVRRLTVEEIVDALVAAEPDLLEVRPLLRSVVRAIVDEPFFERALRSSALDVYDGVVGRGRGNVVLDIAEAGTLALDALDSVSPKLRDEIRARVQPQLVTLSRQELPLRGVRAIDHTRLLGIVLPAAALLCLGLGIAAAPERRRAGVAAGLGAVAAGLVLAGIVAYGRVYAGDAAAEAAEPSKERAFAGAASADASGDPSADLARAAARAAYGTVVGDLLLWALVVAALGALAACVLVAAAPRPGAAGRTLRRIAEPATADHALARSLAAAALGATLLLAPGSAPALVVAFGGLALLGLAVGDAIASARRLRAEELVGRALRRRRTGLAIAAGAGALVVVALAGVAVIGGEDDEERRAGSVKTCNGLAGLCDMRVNDVAWPGTHNAFSAADLPGWYFANQRRPLSTQLAEGMRVLLLDTHYGVRGRDGTVRTDLRAEGKGRNRVAKELSPRALAVAERLVGRVGFGELRGDRDVYLCHSLCELGAVLARDALEDIRRFLDRRPGEVVMLQLESGVTPIDTERVFREAGLLGRVAVLDRNRPLPTLRELIATGKRLLVLTEHDGGALPWYLPAFSFLQDTPLGAKRPSQLRCTRYRGDADSPIFALNHWIDVFPPSPESNERINGRRAILARVRRCERERGMPVSVIAVDHYDRGDVIGAAAQLNRERVRARVALR